MKRTHILNFSISIGSYASFINAIISLAENRISSMVCVANVHMFIEAYRDSKFNKIIEDADLVTPDGQPLTWFLNAIYSINQERVAGMDLLPDLLVQLEKTGLSAYFYGGSLTLLNKAQHYFNKNNPRLKIAGLYSPPFRKLTAGEEIEVIDNINTSGANIVFVALGCPKQEKWMASMKGKINAVMIGIGGALPVTVEVQKRAPKWMQNSGSEWLYRLLQEPKRLFLRYAVTNSIFLFLFVKEILFQKVFKRNIFKQF